MIILYAVGGGKGEISLKIDWEKIIIIIML